MSTKKIGDQGEQLAASFLEQKGYRILERNYRFERAEVDLVCYQPAERYEDGGELVFVEVKTRSGLGFGRPEEAVDEAKQQNVVRAAGAFLYEFKLEGSPCRFDVVTVLLNKSKAAEITHFEHAFYAS